jgi:hypothetical protein
MADPVTKKDAVCTNMYTCPRTLTEIIIQPFDFSTPTILACILLYKIIAITISETMILKFDAITTLGHSKTFVMMTTSSENRTGKSTPFPLQRHSPHGPAQPGRPVKEGRTQQG